MSFVERAARTPIIWFLFFLVSVDLVYSHESGNGMIFREMWGSIFEIINSLSSVSEGAGAFIGSLVGLLALLLGALYNARLMRARDDRIRNLEIVSLASAFMGEIASLYNIATLRDYLGDFEKFAAHKEETGNKIMPNIPIRQSYTTIFEAYAGKIGLLPPPLPHDIVHVYTYLKSFLEDVETMNSGVLDEQDISFQVSFIRNAHMLLENLLRTVKYSLLPMLSTICDGDFQLLDDIVSEDCHDQNNAGHHNEARDHGAIKNN